MGIGKSTLFEDLQQGVEDVGMGLFDLVKKDHGEGLAPHSFGELSTLFVTDVSRGRTHQTADGVLFHVLGHVEGDER